MKSFKTPLLLAFIVFLSCFGIAAVGQDKPVYLMMNFIKVDRNKSQAYIDLIKNYGSKVWQARVNSGELISWTMYSVAMTTDGQEDYNFVGIASANSVKNLMEASTPPKDLLKAAMPGATDKMIQDVLDSYGEVREVRNAVILKMVDHIAPKVPRKTMEVNFMAIAPGKTAEYVRLETEVFKPVHEERIKAGEITGWGLYEVAYPWSDTRPYSYITTNGFNDWDKMINSDYGGAYKKAFPKGDLNKLWAQTLAARSMYKTEIWNFVTRVDATTK